MHPDGEWPADRFETHRTYLRAMAYRMLGSVPEATDAGARLMRGAREVAGRRCCSTG
jgi:hypothetical protein